MKKIAICTLFFVLGVSINVAISGGVMRMILPTDSDLASYPVVNGELAQDSETGLLKIFRDGAFNLLRSVLPSNSELLNVTVLDGELSYDKTTGLVNVGMGGQRSKLRTALYDSAELESLNPLDGELAYESSTGRILVRNGGTFKKPDVYVEKLPIIYGNGDRIDVSPGKIVIENSFYINQSSVSCSFSTSGVGGVDSGSDFQDKTFAYIYLVPNGSGFGCIISSSYEGPIASYQGWKRVASPMLTFTKSAVGEFFSRDGVTSYEYNSGLAMFTTGGCQAWDLSANVPATAYSVFVNFGTPSSTPPAFEAIFYSSSDCSGYNFSGHEAINSPESVIEFPIQTSQTLYYVHTTGSFFPVFEKVRELIVESGE